MSNSNIISITNNKKSIRFDLSIQNNLKYKLSVNNKLNTSDNYVNINFFINTQNTDGSGNILVDSYLNEIKVRTETFNFNFSDVFVDKLVKLNTDYVIINFNYDVLNGNSGEIVGNITQINLPLVSRIYGSEDVPIKTDSNGKLLIDISGQTDISGQRVDISGQTVIVSGITFDTTDLNVDISGQRVDISGQTVIVQGGIDISGQTIFTNDLILQNSSNNINTSIQNLKNDLSGLYVFDSTVNANVAYSSSKLSNIFTNSTLTNVYLESVKNNIDITNNKLDTIQLICSNIITSISNSTPRTFYSTENSVGDISDNNIGLLIDVSNIPIIANVSLSAKSDISNNKTFGWVGSNTNNINSAYLITDIKTINNSIYFPSFNFSNGVPVKYIGIFNNTTEIFSNVTYKIHWSI